MKPRPWSPSGLAEIKNCPKQFHETRILRRFKQERNTYNDWGDRVHTAFEKFFLSTPIPEELKAHEDYLGKLHDKRGPYWLEQKVAFNKRAEPCSWDEPEETLWARFKIDYLKVDLKSEPPIAYVVDYKTGKQKDDFTQLVIYALWTFAKHPVDLVDVRYYWTQTETETRKVYGREEVPALWEKIMPDLLLWRDAFRNETWQARQSGLCKGWCSVTDCQFWEPKRS